LLSPLSELNNLSFPASKPDSFYSGDFSFMM
jgi:hypothetical protein